MKRRSFLYTSAGLLLSPWLAAENSSKYQFCLLQLGSQWNQRQRALIKLSFEIQKRCNIPIESSAGQTPLSKVAQVNSPFFVLSGEGDLPMPSLEETRLLRLVLSSGGVLLIDDTSPKGDDRFYKSCQTLMKKVYPEIAGSTVIPSDHAVYQSYYLLKQPRGRLNKADYMEGWTLGHRTQVFFSHNDLLGAMQADALGNWKYNMEIGGTFRRELCFRLGINMTYYVLTLNYKKDRAFPPIIERRRRL